MAKQYDEWDSALEQEQKFFADLYEADRMRTTRVFLTSPDEFDPEDDEEDDDADACG